jgi:serine/threonine-protein kinase RsbT
VSRSITLDVIEEGDRLWASGAARRFLATHGFSMKEQAQVALCVAELASNVAKHGGGGRIELTYVDEPARGCRVRATDDGPGILAVDDALADGFSEGRWLTPDVPSAERHGLGVGLGTVRRLMSDVTLSARPQGGLLIDAVLWHSPGDDI